MDSPATPAVERLTPEVLDQIEAALAKAMIGPDWWRDRALLIYREAAHKLSGFENDGYLTALLRGYAPALLAEVRDNRAMIEQRKALAPRGPLTNQELAAWSDLVAAMTETGAFVWRDTLAAILAEVHHGRAVPADVARRLREARTLAGSVGDGKPNFVSDTLLWLATTCAALARRVQDMQAAAAQAASWLATGQKNKAEQVMADMMAGFVYPSSPPMPTPAAQAPPPSVEQLTERVVREVAELPDRTSPAADYDHMLVTGQELTVIVRAALEELRDALTDGASPAVPSDAGGEQERGRPQGAAQE